MVVQDCAEWQEMAMPAAPVAATRRHRCGRARDLRGGVLANLKRH
jgi:hypothetical protein